MNELHFTDSVTWTAADAWTGTAQTYFSRAETAA